MRPSQHEIRRTRLRRGALTSLHLLSLLSFSLSVLAPRLTPWFGTPRIAQLLVASVPALVAMLAQYKGRNAGPWSVLDDTAWVLTLVGLSVLGGAARGAPGAHALLFSFALLSIALRDPSGTLVVIACATTALMPVVRMLLDPSPAAVAPVAVSAIAMGTAFVTVLVLSRRLSQVLYQRDALFAERERVVRAAGAVVARPTVTVSTSGNAESLVSRIGAMLSDETRRTSSSEASDGSWDGLIERVRASMQSLSESSGVEANVHAELSGLAPPSSKIRNNLVRIVQEAATNAIRTAEPRSLHVRLRRGEGGVVLEFEDDGIAGENARSRRVLAPLKGRIAALGGSADIRRSDRGWVMRVKLPSEQLN